VRPIRFFLLVFVLLSPIGFALPASASTKVADCIELKFPKATTTSTVFKLTVEVYAICTEEQIGRGKGQRPLFSMPEEESLFNLDSCSGPTAQPRSGLSNGYLGTATCSLRVGSNTLPSPRTGATSTTMRMWFAWDFSTKTISVPHVAIPAGTNNGWGGSTGSGTTVPKVPVVPSCTAAPLPPKITSVISFRGLQITVTPSVEGDRPQALAWATTFYSRDAQTWESWSKWNDVQPPKEISFLAESSSTRQKIAVQAYSYNTCGSSTNAREAADNKGIEIVSTADIDAANESNDALNAAELAEESLTKIESEITLATREVDAMVYQLNEKIGQIIADLQKMIKDLSTIIAKMAKN
jgi:hypothetical protein